MQHTLLPIIHAFESARVLVIGEAMLDSYVHGHTDRLCREAPVPVVEMDAREDVPGGAANAAVNAHTLGARVTFLSVVGADAEGELLAAALARGGVSPDGLVRDSARRTLVKQRVLAGPQILLRLDAGSTANVSGEAEQDLIHRLRAAWPDVDAVIVSDYGYGVLTPAVVAALAERQQESPRVLVADAKDLGKYKGVRPTAVKPNYAEAVRLLNLPHLHDEADRLEQVTRFERAFLDATGARIAAVTLDVAGALVFEDGRPAYRTYTTPSPNSRATGAGDTFVGALALALACGADTPAAADLASAAATVVVARDGTTACTLAELRLQLTSEGKVLEEANLAARVDGLKRSGKRIVFTNGCFDILHRGHITYLSRAKALGDVLIVGLNSDASVKRLKGDTRPINAFDDRAQVLAALSCVDHIIGFSEDTPAHLIEAIRPDVFVKGGDYTKETLPEAPLVESLGGEVQLLTYLEDFSTTGIIERAKLGTRQAGD